VDEDNNEIPELRDSEFLFRKDIPKDVTVFEVNGPFFYSVADLLSEALIRLEETPKVFILKMGKVPIIDTTGIRALKEFQAKCKRKGILFLISGVSKKIREQFGHTSVESTIGVDHIFPNIDSALLYVKQHVLGVNS
jgi:SulP family sulfate permease